MRKYVIQELFDERTKYLQEKIDAIHADTADIKRTLETLKDCYTADKNKIVGIGIGISTLISILIGIISKAF